MRLSIVVLSLDPSIDIEPCLKAILVNRVPLKHQVKVVVALNGHSAELEEAARKYNARLFFTDHTDPALANNAAAVYSTGDVLIFLNAGDCISPLALDNITLFLEPLIDWPPRAGEYIGGSARVLPHESSLKHIPGLVLQELFKRVGKVSLAMAWCRRRDFFEIGGFLPGPALDKGCTIDFAHRLRDSRRDKRETLRRHAVCLRPRIS